MYGESTTKYYDKGFRVNCLILFDEPVIEQDEFDKIKSPNKRRGIFMEIDFAKANLTNLIYHQNVS